MSGHSHAPGKGLILVVDDEALVRMGAADVVEEAGFDVVEASNADDAIRILESRVAAAVKRRWPPIHIIVVSGHYRTNENELHHGAVFLSKPYQPSQLATHIRRLAA